MDWKQLTLADICRLVEAIDQAGGNPEAVQSIIDRAPVRAMEHGRIAMASLLGLLEQTRGSTMLPPAVLALLNGPEQPPHEQPIRPTTSPERARAIMGNNMFGIEEAARLYGLQPLRRHLAALADVPFSPEVLAACAGSHLLAAVFPLSLRDIRHQTRLAELPYRLNIAVAGDGEAPPLLIYRAADIGWYLVRKDAVPHSDDKDWRAQQELLAPDEELPTAAVLVYTMVGHFLVTGEQLFQNEYVRTASRNQAGDRACVGDWDDYNLINYYGDNDAFPVLWLSSAKKYPE